MNIKSQRKKVKYLHQVNKKINNQMKCILNSLDYQKSHYHMVIICKTFCCCIYGNNCYTFVYIYYDYSCNDI